MASPLVIVSNRLPISVKRTDAGLELYPSVGGLATGLATYVSDRRNKWIGWPGIASDGLSEKERQFIAVELRKQNCYPVFLKQKQLNDFYNGYSNTILWPLFHDLPARMEDHDKFWKAYKAVNSAFAGVVLALSDASSAIWVHDYQLLLLPALLRAVRPKAKIGFFLHIPFPGVKRFRKLPSAKQLLLGMLGSDLLGMHTRTYGENFLQACTELTSEIVAPGQVIHGSNVTRVTDFPMGIDYDRFMRAREMSAVQEAYRQHRQKYKGMKVILTVDRLDPTKGLAERLEAYREFLRRTPDIHGRVIMVMLAVPSRTEIDEYKQLRRKVEKLVQGIIDEFGTPSWQPIDYMYTSLPVEAVTALYQVADVAFITPLRDGMNLVAKEYIASRPRNDGILILSSTAGAAQELTDAILVDPRNRESLVEALVEAVKMPRSELKRRVAAMQDNVATNTVQYWASNFMNSLQKPLPGTRRITWTLTPQHTQDLVGAYRRAAHPVVLLDYDGVLAPHILNPLRAKPSHNLIKVLEKLGQIDKLDMAIISGRDKDELTDWLGNLPISLVAEHGAMMRSYHQHTPGQSAPGDWHRLTRVSPAWQDELQPILEKYAANTPGASVEVKNFSLVWHYRRASPYYAQKHLVILRRILRPLIKTYDLGMYNGDKILEIKPLDINKGTAVSQLLEQFSKYGPAPDFILCIGDDYTDEDMFETLPASAYTIKVGRLRTAARFRVRSADQVYSLLKRLAK